MADIRIEVVNGSYNNEDAYDNLIHYIVKEKYILNSHYFGAYGVYPVTPETASEQFQKSKEESTVYSACNLWHFFISYAFPIRDSINLSLADEIARLFSNEYQVFYGIHTHQVKSHVHYAINSYSYHPQMPPLNEDSLRSYMKKIKLLLNSYYPGKEISLQFRKKGVRNV